MSRKKNIKRGEDLQTGRGPLGLLRSGEKEQRSEHKSRGRKLSESDNEKEGGVGRQRTIEETSGGGRPVLVQSRLV